MPPVAEVISSVYDVRCPKCEKLVARRVSDGTLEIRIAGQTIARVRCGDIVCPRCGVVLYVVDKTHPYLGAQGTDSVPLSGDLTRSPTRR